ncbi:hypothetical protein AWI85_05985 [Listeria monocytogenes]|uniref:hypothetical protein n=1 Tax=Listeria monocytogenes TaxID=1639 RepID=UPI0007758659|nr:hypothetical protein [Listeria monocytogenes]EAD0080278.1 hypothetical protein [Listeria monocytogenes]EAE0845964.1 hypothetical protein [Listeria monocytogenes]EAF8771729.1 hypothetical protein [Listeria monocytogenes]EEA6131058.1 hypothetical protein [Listeria monocytogenes]EKZ1452125.1 hypothetical protein [Listeria monocytogenes]
MLIRLEELRAVLKESGLPVFRDKATNNTPYPYIVYSFVSKKQKFASGKVLASMINYQISIYSNGTEQDIKLLDSPLKKNQIPYTAFMGVSGDENDETITNYFTYVDVLEDE